MGALHTDYYLAPGERREVYMWCERHPEIHDVDVTRRAVAIRASHPSRLAGVTVQSSRVHSRTLTEDLNACWAKFPRT